MGCKSLKGITIPNSVTSIGEEAFGFDNYIDIYCSSLKEMTILSDTLSLKKSSLENIKNLENITIPYVHWKVFKKLPYPYKKITITSAKSIGKGAFKDIQSLEEVSIPDNVKIIPESAFENCTNLKTFKISENVRTIKDYAFKGCENLEIEIPKTVKTVGIGVFDGVKKVTYLD